MTRLAAILALALALAAAPAPAAERFAVIAVGDPPAGPDGDLAELAYQLRAACRDRVPNVEDPPTMRARLSGQGSSATESELDRAYGGALAVYQNGEFESALRTFRAIVEDLEALPETEESYFQWKRSLLRLAHAAMAANDGREVESAFGKLARVEPNLLPDPDQFSPTFRKRFEEVKARVRLLPRRKLTITALGRQGTVYVHGKAMGTTPLTVTLPTGTYRIGGAAGALRVPSFRADLDQEDRTVTLDFALAESLRLSAGPGLALASGERAYGIIRAGAWLGVDKLVVVTRTDEGQAQFLVGSIYDVLRGALLREGSVRMVAGGVPSVNLSALAAFLLTGQSSREVKELSHEPARRAAPAAAASPPAAASAATPAATAEKPALAPVAAATAPAPPASASPPAPSPPSPSPMAASPPPAPPPAATQAPKLDALPVPPRPAAASSPARSLPGPEATPAQPDRRPRWTGPAAIVAGGLAVGLAGLAIQQNGASHRAYSEASAQLRPDGSFKDAAAQARWHELRAEGDREGRNATSAGVAAAGLAVAAGILGWNAWHGRPERGAAVAWEF